MEGAIQELKRWEGIEQPVLEAPLQECRCVEMGRAAKKCTASELKRKECKTVPGWNGSWAGMMRDALARAGVAVRGGIGLPKLRERDCCLVDIADPEERELIRAGCLAAEAWRVSEFVGLDGRRVRKAALAGGALERLVGRQGRVWGIAARRVVVRWMEEVDELGKWERAGIQTWQVVGWASEGRVRLGLVGGQPEEGKVWVRRLGVAKAEVAGHASASSGRRAVS